LARISALYAIEKDIRGKTAAQRQAERQARSRPLVESMHAWLEQQLTRISRSSKLAIAIRYVLKHWQGLTYFLDDGRLELDTNTVEREIRPIVLCRKNALFAGNDSGAEHWAIAATLIASAKLNGVKEAMARQEIAKALLPPGAAHANPEGFHLWLRLSAPWTRGELISRLRMGGIGVVGSDVFALEAPSEAVRLSLGAPTSRGELRRSLQIVADLLIEQPAM
jgi:hypothetical protein